MKGNIVFNPKTYPLLNLINDIETGDIALPDLQRPFVWDHRKVRDLFDSLYKGFPIGTVVLWEIREPGSYRKINLDNVREPRFLVIDGQQRLTSLFSVIKGKEILSKSFKRVKIKISFNPKEEKFEVWNAAIERSPEWISDISEIFQGSLISFVDEYVKKLGSSSLFDPGDEFSKVVSDRIERLRGILNYTVSVLELSSELDPEGVSEIFVRMNSKGKPLNQSDFILTLLAVYWNEGRKAIEKFCESSRKYPEDNSRSPSSFNIIGIKPNPEHIVRTVVGYAFRRGRLKYAYLILKGRDFENRIVSSELRSENLNKFKEGQRKALDLGSWHDFVGIIRSAGFVNEKLISSKVAFFVTYTFYLIGKYDFHIPYKELESFLKKWFVFSQITQRYTSSPESVIERDLSMVGDSAEEFFLNMGREMKADLTHDFWEITLPQKLISSYPQNFAYLVYVAALIHDDVKLMFSKDKLRDHWSWDPVHSYKKKLFDAHHVFPKGYLRRIGITQNRDINQVANLIYLRFKDNIRISDAPPAEYWSELTRGLSEEKIKELLREYDLPWEFWKMDYFDFLEARRKLMANRIKEFFNSL